MRKTYLTVRDYEKKYGVKKAKSPQRTANPRFRDPVHFQLKNPSWKVCQGIIQTEYGPEMHSWLEKQGLVLDLFLGARMLVADYYFVHKITQVKKYTLSECRTLMDKYRTYCWVDKNTEEL